MNNDRVKEIEELAKENIEHGAGDAFVLAQHCLTLLAELRKREWVPVSEWTKTPPTTQGWYWAIPTFPEDADPVMLCLWSDDGVMYCCEDGRSLGGYRAFRGPIPEPPTQENP